MRLPSCSRVLGLLLAVALLAPTAAVAMTVLAADLPDLVKDSQTIVRGQVIEVRNVVLDAEGQPLTDAQVMDRTRNSRPTGLRAFTDVRVRVSERYKDAGHHGAEIKLRLVGGRMGAYTLAVPGMPRFSPGEEVFLFLEETGVGLVPLGAGQGVFRIVPGEKGGLDAVHDLRGMAVLRRDLLPPECGLDEVTSAPGSCALRTGPGLPAIPDRMPLATLDAHVRALLGIPLSTPRRLVPAPPLRKR